MLENKTVRSLEKQTFRDFMVKPVWDSAQMGASWARNQGFRQVATEFVLFSDDDINWFPEAFQWLVDCLDGHPEAAYSYGAYSSNWRKAGKVHTIGHQVFDAALLRQRNFITTMSLIRSSDCPGFDETLERYQDWDLWLTMLKDGKVGVFCGHVLFDTRLSPNGVTFGSIPIEQARAVIARKHQL